MNTTLTSSRTVEAGRRRHGGLVVGVALATTVVAGSLVVGLRRAGSDPDHRTELGWLATRAAAERDAYVAGVAAASREELAGAFGNVPFNTVVLPGTPQWLPATYPTLSDEPTLAEAWRSRSGAFVEWVSEAQPERLAAAFGNAPVEP